MEPYWWLLALWVDVLGLGQAPSCPCGAVQLQHVQRRLAGQLLDFTHNHGRDRRLWSPALRQKRDLYVYLPPGFDPCRRYPLAIFLHGAGQDEEFFLQTQAEQFDRAIRCGALPPVIIAAPDGSVHGRATLYQPATFWANSRVGAFEDYLMCDVWNFLMTRLPILPQREAHALMGASMGGSAAVAHAITHRDRIKIAIAFMPLLNLRHVDCHGHYRTPFDPACAGLREQMRPFEALGRRRLVVLRFHHLFGPMFGHGPEAIAGLSSINPLELMDRCNLQPGELDLYVAYGCKDEFNSGAQVEGFVYAAQQRGIEVTVARDPFGRHDLATGKRLLPGALEWGSRRMPPPR
jgi:S-formylglutathione hydrolase FrmB